MVKELFDGLSEQSGVRNLTMKVVDIISADFVIKVFELIDRCMLFESYETQQLNSSKGACFWFYRRK